jgi:hypothetical protein
MKTITLNENVYRWRDILRARRGQKKQERKAQLLLFELKQDARPQSQQDASSRFSEPLLFD